MYYDEYEQYQSFRSMDDLNEAVRQALYYNADKLNKTAVTTLKLLSRYSCKVIGVSWMKAGTIAQLIGKSEKTARRALKTLEEIGIIKRVPTIRAKGGRGYDLCVIQSVVQAEVSSREESENERESKAQKGIELKETAISNKLNNYVTDDLDASYTPDNVPDRFTKACKPFFGANKIYALWKRVSFAYDKCNLDAEIDSDSVVDTAIGVFKRAIFAMKRGAIRSTFGGYFYGGMLTKLDDLFREELLEISGGLRLEVPEEWS
jgi:DNA-binding Lrp family transcriptional regulator